MKIDSMQFGFMSWRNMTDAIFIVRQDSRPKTNENRRFTRDQPEERREFQHSRRSPGTTRNNRDLSYKSRNSHNNKRPYGKKQERELPAPSKNKNFPQMVKLINRAISIHHHAQNWTTLPVKLSTQLDEFIEGVRPPAPDEELRQQLKKITENYKTEIGKAVRQHLGLALYKTGEELTKIEALDVERAKSTASKQIQMHLRNKIRQEDLNHWSKLAADLVGTHPSVNKQNGEPTEKRRKSNPHMETQEATEEPMSKEPTSNEAQNTKPSENIKVMNKKTPKMTRKPKTRALGYTSLIRRLRTMHIKKERTSETTTTDPATTEQVEIDPTEGETNMTMEDMVVPDTQQLAINWAGEWSDEELPSFQPPKEDNREDDINQYQKLSNENGETTLETKQAKTNQLKKKNLKKKKNL